MLVSLSLPAVCGCSVFTTLPLIFSLYLNIFSSLCALHQPASANSQLSERWNSQCHHFHHFHSHSGWNETEADTQMGRGMTDRSGEEEWEFKLIKGWFNNPRKNLVFCPSHHSSPATGHAWTDAFLSVLFTVYNHCVTYHWRAMPSCSLLRRLYFSDLTATRGKKAKVSEWGKRNQERMGKRPHSGLVC